MSYTPNTPSKAKKILPALVAVVAVLSVGGSAYYLMNKTDPKTMSSKTTLEETAKKTGNSKLIESAKLVEEHQPLFEAESANNFDKNTTLVHFANSQSDFHEKPSASPPLPSVVGAFDAEIIDETRSEEHEKKYKKIFVSENPLVKSKSTEEYIESTETVQDSSIPRLTPWDVVQILESSQINDENSGTDEEYTDQETDDDLPPLVPYEDAHLDSINGVKDGKRLAHESNEDTDDENLTSDDEIVSRHKQTKDGKVDQYQALPVLNGVGLTSEQSDDDQEDILSTGEYKSDDEGVKTSKDSKIVVGPNNFDNGELAAICTSAMEPEILAEDMELENDQHLDANQLSSTQVLAESDLVPKTVLEQVHTASMLETLSEGTRFIRQEDVFLDADTGEMYIAAESQNIHQEDSSSIITNGAKKNVLSEDSAERQLHQEISETSIRSTDDTEMQDINQKVAAEKLVTDGAGAGKPLEDAVVEEIAVDIVRNQSKLEADHGGAVYDTASESTGQIVLKDEASIETESFSVFNNGDLYDIRFAKSTCMFGAKETTGVLFGFQLEDDESLDSNLLKDENVLFNFFDLSKSVQVVAGENVYNLLFTSDVDESLLISFKKKARNLIQKPESTIKNIYEKAENIVPSSKYFMAVYSEPLNGRTLITADSVGKQALPRSLVYSAVHRIHNAFESKNPVYHFQVNPMNLIEPSLDEFESLEEWERDGPEHVYKRNYDIHRVIIRCPVKIENEKFLHEIVKSVVEEVKNDESEFKRNSSWTQFLLQLTDGYANFRWFGSVWSGIQPAVRILVFRREQ